MADIQDALDAILSADATLTNLIGDRCYALAAPAEVAYPYVKYFNVDGVRGVLLNGTFEGTIRERWQFDIYGDNPAIVKAIKARLMDLLLIVHQTINIADGSTAVIQGSVPQGYFQPRIDGDTRKWSCSFDSMISAGVS